MKRSAPLKPTGFKRKPGAAYSSFRPRSKPFENTEDRATGMRRSTLKQRIKKPIVAKGSKYLAACRGEPCYLLVPGCCNGDFATVVPAHSNESAHGKGMGRKADHIYTVPACGLCHFWLDQGPAPREEKFSRWRWAYQHWERVRAVRMGLPPVPEFIPADPATT